MTVVSYNDSPPLAEKMGKRTKEKPPINTAEGVQRRPSSGSVSILVPPPRHDEHQFAHPMQDDERHASEPGSPPPFLDWRQDV